MCPSYLGYLRYNFTLGLKKKIINIIVLLVALAFCNFLLLTFHHALFGTSPLSFFFSHFLFDFFLYKK